MNLRQIIEDYSLQQKLINPLTEHYKILRKNPIINLSQLLEQKTYPKVKLDPGFQIHSFKKVYPIKIEIIMEILSSYGNQETLTKQHLDSLMNLKASSYLVLKQEYQKEVDLLEDCKILLNREEWTIKHITQKTPHWLADHL